MQILNSENRIVYMDKSNPPAAHIKIGDQIKIYCKDCFNDAYFNEGCDERSIVYTNPCTGPVYVDGTNPGDTLLVEIENIETQNVGIVESVPGEGPMGEYITQKTIKKISLSQGMVKFNNVISFPVKPMLGVLGVAPSGIPVRTVDLGDHGGNLDCTSFAVGAKILLPVSVPGALLAVGDLHAVMGDGELGVSGLEVAGSCILRVSVNNSLPVEGPVALFENGIEVIATAKTLDAAVVEATKRLYRIMESRSILEPADISALISLCADVKVCQVVNSQMSVRVRLPLKALSPLCIFNGRRGN